MKRILFLIVVLSVITVTLSLWGQQNGNIELIGRWGNGPCNTATVIDNNYILIGNGVYLELVDVSGTHPEVLNRILLPDVVNDIAVKGSFLQAYIACGRAGLQVVKYEAGYNNPQIAGSYNTDGFAKGIYYNTGNYVYVADGESGLVICEVPLNGEPDLVGVVSTSGPVWDVWVEADTAYVAADTSGFWTVDIGSRDEVNFIPQLIDSIHTKGVTKGIFIQGKTAYLADGLKGLTRIDITKANTLTLIDSWDNGEVVDFTDVYISATNAYISDVLSSVRIVDISGMPIQSDIFYTKGITQKITLNALNKAFVADGGGGMLVLDISIPAREDSLATGDVAEDVLIDEDIIYVASGISGLWILDRSSATENTIEVLSHIDTLKYSQGLAKKDSILLVADAFNGLHIFNVSNPSEPVGLSSIPVTDSALDVDINGDSAVVADAGAGIHIFDISDPNTPTDEGTISVGANIARGVKVDTTRRLAYVSTDVDGVQIVDIENNVLIGATTASTDAFAVDFISNGDDLIYVADGENGILEYDVSDPANPGNPTSTKDTRGSAMDLTMRGKTAIVADSAGTLRMIDFSGIPTEADTFHTAGVSHAVSIYNDTIAVADGEAGIYLLKAKFEGKLVSQYDSLNFGIVAINHDREIGFYLTNTGNEEIQISDVYSSTGVFSYGYYSNSVSPGDTTGIGVMFSPLIETEYEDSLVIVSDAENDTLIIPLRGTGIKGIPLSAYTPDYFTFTLYHMDTLYADTLMRDESNYGYLDGIVNGAEISPTDSGQFGKALEFSNTGDVITISLDSLLYLPDFYGFAVDSWFKLASKPQGKKILFRTALGLDVIYEIAVDTTAAGKTILETSVYDSTLYSDESTGLILNEWTHVALSLGDSARLYYNGNLEDICWVQHEESAGLYIMTVGNASDGVHTFPGLIDEFRMSGISREPWEFNVSTGRISLSTDSLSFGNVLVSNSRNAYLIVQNTGEGLLYVDSLNTTDSRFEVSNSNFSIASGNSQYISVAFTPISDDLAVDTLFIYSRDPTNKIKKVILTGTGYLTQTVGPYTADAYTSALWHMDGLAGDTTIVDESVNNLTGYFEGDSVFWKSDIYRFGNSSLYFNGTTGWLRVPYSTALDFASSPFTIETWFSLAGNPGTNETYVLLYADQYEIFYSDSAGPGAGLFARIYSSTDNEYTLRIREGFDFNLETWYHIAFSWDRSMLRFYINGIAMDSTSFSGTLQTLSNPMSIGAEYGGGSAAFNGYLDEMRFSNIARQPWEFSAVKPVIYTAKDSFSFDDVLVGDSTFQTITITNNGYQPLIISDINWTESTFSVSDTSFQIAVGASQVDTVTFKPQVYGIVKDTLIIISNDPKQDTLLIPMIGTGFSGPRVSAVSQVNFEPVLPGESTIYSLNISNKGDQILLISDINWTYSVFAVSDTIDTIAVGDSSVFTLTFTPSITGEVQDNLVIISNDQRGLVQIPMTGTGMSYRAKKPYSDDANTIALYHFDGTSSSTVIDASGNGHNGTLVNGVTRLDSGYFGGALHLDGINDYVSITSSDDLVFDMSSESFTIEGFFRTDTVSHSLFFKDVYGGNNKANYGLYIDQNGTFVLYGFDSGTTRVTDGAWHHVAFVYDAETTVGYIYLDGNLEFQKEWTSGQTDIQARGALILGAREFSTGNFMYYFEGDIDEVRISSVARKPYEFIFAQTGIEVSLVSTPLLGNALKVNISVPNGSDSETITLYYRKGGESSFNSITADTSTYGSYQATIPGKDVTIQGLEYYVEKKTESDTVTYPLYDPLNKPLKSKVKFSSAISGITLETKKYTMISVPADLNKPSVYDVLRDDMGAYTPLNWRFFSWKDTGYIEYSDTLASTDSVYFNFTRGKSFWIIPVEGKIFDTGAGYTAPTDSAHQFSLKPQWNMIGSPFPFPVAWDDCILHSDSIGTLYYYDGTGYRLDWTIMYPWRGYWIYNAELRYVNFSVPPRQAVLSKTLIPKGGILHNLHEDSWLFKISIETESAKDLDNYIGVRMDAKEDWDLRDRFEPPPIGEYVALYFDHSDWESYSGKYAADIRAPGEDGYVWEFVVESQLSRKSVTMNWNLIQNIPEGWISYIIDKNEGVSINLKEKNSCQFVSEKHVPNFHGFQILVGSPEFVENESNVPLHPVKFHLFQNYPNPFNPGTIIKYTLPKNGRVKLTIYNMLGQEIRVLVDEDKKVGENQTVWDGKTDRGNLASSGIYFYKLEFPNKVAVRKLVIVR